MSDDYSADAQTSGLIQPGASVTGRIESLRDVDWFRISLDANTYYQFSLTSAVAGEWTSMWSAPRISVWDPAGWNGRGDVLEAINRGAYGYDPTIWVKSAAAGIYFIRVNGESVGTYRLSATTLAADDFADTYLGAPTVAPGQVVHGRIEVARDTDAFLLDLKPGVTYSFLAEGDSSGGQAAVPEVAVYSVDASGQTNRVSAYFLNGFPVNVTPTNAKLTYYATVVQAAPRDDSGVGAYRFSYQATADDYRAWIDTTGTIAVGKTVSGALELPADRDWFKFSAIEGQTYTFTSTALPAQRKPGSNYMSLFDADGTRLPSHTLDELDTNRSFLTWTAPKSGQYFVEMSTTLLAVPYTLSMASTEKDDYSADAATTGLLPAPGAIDGKLELLYDQDWIKVHVDAGNAYTFTLSNKDIRTFDLVDANGKTVNTSYDALGVISYRAEQSADFYLKIADGRYAGMDYTISAQTTQADTIGNDVRSMATLMPGAVLRSALDYIGDEDWLRVELVAGQKYSFVIDGATNGGGTLVSPYVLLRDGAGKIVNYPVSLAGKDPYIDATPSQSGVYYLAVSSSGNGTGSYTLKMGDASTPVVDTKPPGVAYVSGPDLARGINFPFYVVFTEAIARGHGTVNLREHATGTLLESFDVATSTRLKIFSAGLDITPTMGLKPGTEYALEIPAGAFVDMAGLPLPSAVQLVIRTADASRSQEGGSGNDIFFSGSGNDYFNGGDGVDTVFYQGQNSKDFDVTPTRTSVQVHQYGYTQQDDVLVSIERIVFDNAVFARDIQGVAGQVYRLYQAAFDRRPDSKGLGYWIGAMDRGVSLKEVAANLAASPEFQGKYGAALSNEEYLSAIYGNTLHRTPDKDGLAYWVDAMQRGIDHADVLMYFSESAENQLAMNHIQGGFWFTPFN